MSWKIQSAFVFLLAAFLSSVDIHITFQYQRVVEPSVAIVCSNIDGDKWFRLTDYGMKTISECNKRPHSHHSHPQSKQLVEELNPITCNFLIVDDGLKFKVVDYR